ncbi:protein Hikeshi, partial [Tremellales sp. Uapishka_1]
MFGAIAAGRLVQTNLQQIDETHFAFPLEQPYEINHLTVFLLGTTPFPEGYGASVHFAWPGKDYIPLGTLTNGRPSAIYRLRPHLPSDVPVSSPPATLGIEIAPLGQLEALQATIASSSGKEVVRGGNQDIGKIAEKVVKNLFNYLHSFGGDVTLTPETPIPLSVFQQWYTNFTRKIENDKGASFLERDD